MLQQVDKKGIGAIYNNVGLIYMNQGNYEKAFEYYSKCLAISKEIGDKKGMGSFYYNIGLIYKDKGNNEKAPCFSS